MKTMDDSRIYGHRWRKWCDRLFPSWKSKEVQQGGIHGFHPASTRELAIGDATGSLTMRWFEDHSIIFRSSHKGGNGLVSCTSTWDHTRTFGWTCEPISVKTRCLSIVFSNLGSNLSSKWRNHLKMRRHRLAWTLDWSRDQKRGWYFCCRLCDRVGWFDVCHNFDPHPLHKAHHYRDFLNGDRYSLWFVDGNNNRISFEWKDEDMIKCEVRTKEGTGKEALFSTCRQNWWKNTWEPSSWIRMKQDVQHRVCTLFNPFDFRFYIHMVRKMVR